MQDVGNVTPDPILPHLHHIHYVPWPTGIRLLGVPLGSAEFVSEASDAIVTNLSDALDKFTELGCPHSASLIAPYPPAAPSRLPRRQCTGHKSPTASPRHPGYNCGAPHSGSTLVLSMFAHPARWAWYRRPYNVSFLCEGFIIHFLGSFIGPHRSLPRSLSPRHSFKLCCVVRMGPSNNGADSECSGGSTRYNSEYSPVGSCQRVTLSIGLG